MPDVLLFGATGYTGRLTAEALGRRDASFVVAGRDPRKLEELAARTGAADARSAEVGDVESLTTALADCKAIISCVGPFRMLGDTAAEAAIRAGVHYVDSTGELDFVDHLISNYGSRARSAGIVMAPSMGFDEVPSDVALSLAVEGIDEPEAVVTYALPTHASTGTLRTMVAGIATTKPRWIRDGRPEEVATASRSRWAPMPPPLGPKLGVSVPLAEGRLAPLHLELRSLELYMIVGRLQATAMRAGMPVANVALRSRMMQSILGKALDMRSSGPSEATRASDRWTILAEARNADTWRNVALRGTDPYGLTGETLAAGGLKLATEGHPDSGVMAPVQAIGLETLHKVLIDRGVNVQSWEPVS